MVLFLATDTVLFLEKGQSAPGCNETHRDLGSCQHHVSDAGVGNWTAIEWSREKGVTDPDFICTTGRRT